MKKRAPIPFGDGTSPAAIYKLEHICSSDLSVKLLQRHLGHQHQWISRGWKSMVLVWPFLYSYKEWYLKQKQTSSPWRNNFLIPFSPGEGFILIIFLNCLMEIQDICYTSILYISLDYNSTSLPRTYCTPYSGADISGFWWVLTKFNFFPFIFFLWSFKSNTSSYYKYRKALHFIGLLPPMGFLANTTLNGQKCVSCPETGGAIKTPQTYSLPSLTIHPDSILPPVDQNQYELTLPKTRIFYLATVLSVTEWENAGISLHMQRGFKSPSPTQKIFISVIKSECQLDSFLHHVTCRQSVVADSKLP